MPVHAKSFAWSVTLGLLFWATVGARAARADTIRLTFEGLGQTGRFPCAERIADFYNGGFGGGPCGAPGHGPGPDLGIVFSQTSLALIDADAGGNGNFGGEPSPNTVMFFNPTGPAVMNVARGFSGSLGVFYSSGSSTGALRVFAGFNGTGALLGNLFLPPTPVNGAPDPTGIFSPLVAVQLPFKGLAHSAAFDGPANGIVFDDVTTNVGAPTPEPGSLWLISMALLGLGRRFVAIGR